MVKQYGQHLYKIAQFFAYVHQAAADKRFLDTPGVRVHLAVAMSEMSIAARTLELEQSRLFVEDLLRESREASLADIFTQDTIKSLDRVFRNELGNAFFKHLNIRQQSLYSAKEPFGDKVGLKFSRAIGDIEEAAKCLALERPTACVFHLMRTMETVLQYFGQSMGLASVEWKEWQTILNELNKPIKALLEATPQDKTRKEELIEASTLLFNVKFAWRNPVMHPRDFYTLEQAHEIYEAVRAFSAYLADIL